MKSFCAVTGLVLFGLAAPGLGLAQGYPSKPIRMVVPFAPGSATDIVARAVADPLSKRLEVPIYVENREGAGGIVGTTNVIRAAPDGYTIMMTSNPVTLAPYMHLRAPFDPVDDLAAVTRVVTMPLAVVTGAQDGIKTLPELIAYIKAHPGKTNFASIGIGSQSHLQGEWLKGTFGLDIVHVPYQSGNTAAIDTASGSVAFFVPTYAATIPLINAGKVRVLAVGSAKRFPAAPDVPTVAEALGMPDARMEAWFGILVPKDTPATIVARLNDAVVQVMASKELAARISALNASVEVMQTPEFRKQLHAESDKWHPIIDRLGLRTE